MDSDQKLAWVLEHWRTRRLDAEIDRVFQRLYYFLVASAFMLGGFATLVTGTPESGSRSLSWILVVAGGLLSILFWAMNTWNCRIVHEYVQWLKPAPKDQCAHPKNGSPAWLQCGELPSLADADKLMREGFEECRILETYSLRKAIGDLSDAKKAAWFARYIPFVMGLIWLSLGIVAWAALGCLWSITVIVLVMVLPSGIVGCRAYKGARKKEGTADKTKTGGE